MQIYPFEESDISYIHSFLKKNEASSQYLINNLIEHGPHLTGHQNSGNYKIIKQNNDIIGIYSLTKRGNLIIEAENDIKLDAVLENALKENIALKGFIGKWTLVDQLYQLYRKKNPDYKPSLCSKEILYTLALPSKEKPYHMVRLLDEQDFDAWKHLHLLFNEERNLFLQVSEEERQIFQARVLEKRWWGLFSFAGQLISMAGLSAINDTAGQVGGVFTIPEFRRNGYSRSVILALLHDCYRIHGHRKNIVFTGSENDAAQKLYESIGYERTGYFGLILS